MISYEAYFVNGFDEGIIDEDGQLRIRGGRGSQKKDNNEDKAVVGRLGYSPVLGTNIGASLHTGDYDDAGEHRLTMAALDAKVTFGALELQGEAAWADRYRSRGVSRHRTEAGGRLRPGQLPCSTRQAACGARW